MDFVKAFLDFLDGDAEEVGPIGDLPKQPEGSIKDITSPQLDSGVPSPNYFVEQNRKNATGTAAPTPGVGDNGDNFIEDTDYKYGVYVYNGGFGASAGLTLKEIKFHSRDDGTELFGHGGDDWILGYGGNDTLDGGTGDDILEGGAGNDIMWGGDDRDLLLGGEDNDDMHGGEHDDVLDGADGDDTLVGDAGADTLYGGRGNDVYVVGDSGDRVFEDASAEGGNADKIYTTLSSYDLSGYDKGVGVEDLQYIGTGSFVGYGNQLSNWIVGAGGWDTLDGMGGDDHLAGGEGRDTLYGGAGNDWLNGEAGLDWLYGGTGNDTYVVGAGDEVIEQASHISRVGGVLRLVSGGIDTVETALNSYSLGNNVENLTFTGTGRFVGTGNDLNNIISGGSANDSLEGGFGNDTLYGGGDNDFLDGSFGNDALYGGFGDDRMVGGDGDDTYYLGSRLYFGRDTIVEHPNWGTDTVVYNARTSLGEFGYRLAENVENLTFTGSAGIRGWGNRENNVITGNSGVNTLYGLEGNDTLDGGGGLDTLVGGADNDTYRISASLNLTADNVVEDVAGGIDTVIWTPLTSFRTPNYTLGDNVENLTMSGSLRANGSGNELDNVLRGNAGDNTLRGLGGNDTLDGRGGYDILIGGAGDDTYRVGSSTFQKPDDIIEDANAGIDTVIYTPLSSLTSVTPSYTLGDNLENLTLGGTRAADGIGNAAANVVFGNTAANTLRGLAGNDTLNGGFANESDSRGNDGDDIIDGGLGDDTIVVSYGTDTVDGGEDTDTLSFAWVGADLNVDLGLGNTSFYESGGYQTATGFGGWISLVTVSWTRIENLMGGLGDDILAGNAGDNRLEGGAGADTFAFVDNWGNDTVADFADGSERLDMRKVTGLFDVDQLAIEDTATGAKLTFAGNSITLTGLNASSLTDADFLFAPAPLTIIGTEGNDVLEGGLANDTIRGLGGDDVLRNVDNADTVDGGAGYDFVYASARTDSTGFTFTVAGSNVEYINGSEGNDVIDGSGVKEGFTQMHGDAGNDVFKGGDGIEWMFGGMGNDTAVFSGNRADYTIVEDQDEWTGWTGITNNNTGVLDWVISVEKLQFDDVTIDAPGQRMQVIGDADADFLAAGGMSAEMFGLDGNDELTAGSGNDIIYGGRGSDTMSGGDGGDVFYIDNDDTVLGGAGYDYAFADNSEGPVGLTFDMTGTSVEFVWGGMGNDVIDGSRVTAGEFWFGAQVEGDAGDDVLIGGALQDNFSGGEGIDTFIVAGNRAAYTIKADERFWPGHGGTEVTEIATGVSDWLYDVESVKFADGTWPLLA